ncbi:MAG: aryl-sulfate sulfotransferase [Phycisphaerae bacterium]|nr:aryl-sulfate sulfotransferase [Phycisphaerae bacterium]
MRRLTVGILAAFATLCPAVVTQAQRSADRQRMRGRMTGRPSAERGPTKTGVLRSEAGAFEGYTLFAPLLSTTTYLIDMQGKVTHSWKSDVPPGNAVYLLDNGHLLRCGHERGNRTFHGGGMGGRIREMDWDGNVVWEFLYANDRHCQHHDIEPMPNGNVLIIAWERKSREEAIAAGRDPALLSHGEVWPDHVVEVKPNRPRGGTIVWEWHVWDHLIQDHDRGKANYGVVADHPELIDLNYVGEPMGMPREQRQRLESLGYIQPSARRRPTGNADWNHTNSIAYNPKLDQIALSVHQFNEIWVIDHGTTTEQAAGHTGGRSGKGGDLLYRWGNPQAYRAGGAADRRLFAQHDAQWIAQGAPGEGHLLVFNNGGGRPDGDYSSVDEIAPPLDAEGRYARKAGAAFGPADSVWRYASPKKSDFFSGHISGAQRLPNGNTLICSGEQGRLLEVDSNGKIVWEYVSPFGGEVRPPGPPGGPEGRFGPPPGGPPPNGGRGWLRRMGLGPPPGGPWGPPGGHDGPNALFRATRLAPGQVIMGENKLKSSAP